ncbi:hypothetical protein SAMN04515665_109131 [Blastococcus sp. DSM 46786]|uniref:hypothetical protein n=1 Tax=Blastococcus sp. DSM 46786 TaxID=1798227 RepID=UPI0008D5C09D|nr:hypothetical protein [Blastococcus sp. DSM 46786]SEL20389.1 hypothetical protein SAMN04515665_109131 [Blastococcus sp. DSM 46786]
MTTPGALLPDRSGTRPDPAPSGLLARPGAVLGAVLVLVTFVPTSRVSGNVAWGMLATAIVAVLWCAWLHATRLRWSAPAVLLLLSGACAALSTQHHGSLRDLVQGLLTTTLLAGCCLLAAYCGPSDRDVVVTVVLTLALAQLACAAASAFLGAPAPWGLLGEAGSLFGTNPLLPAVGGRTTGTMAHPIPFGTLMAAAAALAATARRPGPAARVALTSAFGSGVLLSGSRSAAIVLLVGVVAGLLWPGATRAGAAGRVLVALGAGLALLVSDVSEHAALTSLEGTGSLTHRLGALEAVGRLLGRPLPETLFGSGEGSLRTLYADGLLQQDGFFAVDNQLVTTFALAGLVGTLCLVLAVMIGLLRGDRSTRAGAMVVVLMFASFDTLAWTSTAVLFAVLLALGAARPVPADAG